MKAKELAEQLMQNPEADVCMEYIPYGGPSNIFATYYEAMNIVLLDYAESDEDD